MKTLTLFRHARSGWDDPAARDFDRALNACGHAGAHAMGRHLRELGIEFDQVVSSPAVRCIETLDDAWDGYGKTLHPSWDKRVYLASAATLLDVVNGAPDSTGRLLLCGHNPGLEDLILMLVPDGADVARDLVEEDGLPTAAIAELTIDARSWAEVAANSARLARYIRPGDLDPALGAEG